MLVHSITKAIQVMTLLAAAVSTNTVGCNDNSACINLLISSHDLKSIGCLSADYSKVLVAEAACCCETKRETKNSTKAGESYEELVAPEQYLHKVHTYIER